MRTHASIRFDMGQIIFFHTPPVSPMYTHRYYCDTVALSIRILYFVMDDMFAIVQFEHIKAYQA
jgi:hypothetical protein